MNELSNGITFCRGYSVCCSLRSWSLIDIKTFAPNQSGINSPSLGWKLGSFPSGSANNMICICGKEITRAAPLPPYGKWCNHNITPIIAPNKDFYYIAYHDNGTCTLWNRYKQVMEERNYILGVISRPRNILRS